MSRRETKITIIHLLIAVAIMVKPAMLSSQVSLERQVIGSAGSFTALAGGVSVSSTTGEAVIQTFAAGPYILTQGFQQSNAMLLEELSFLDVPTQSVCPDVKNGKIEVNSLDGCLEPYVVRLRKYENGNFITVDSIPKKYKFETVVFENLGIDTFLVEVIGATYCVKSDTFFLDAKNPGSCALKVYTGITPNNDGSNDSWIIDNIEVYESNQVMIFNRWGSLVWEAKNYNNADIVWRGENKNGNDLPDATYFYVINADGEKFDGWVEITR